MAFEIIKRLLTIEAAVHGLTGRRRKLGDQLGVVRMAVWTFDRLLTKHFRRAKLLPGIGGCNTKGFEFFLSFFRHPICRPGGRKSLLNTDVAKAFFDQLQPNVHANDIHGGAARVCRCDNDGDLIFFHFYIPHNAQINNRKHRHFRVFYLLQDVPELLFVYCCMKACFSHVSLFTSAV